MRGTLLLFCLFDWLFASHSSAATLAGQQVQPGGKIEIRFPVSKYFQDIAAQAGNPRPETGRAVLAFPFSFDPARSWPILIVTSTSDFNLTSAMDVVRRVRVVAHSGAGLDSARVLVGGFAAASVDLQDELLHRFPLLVGVVLLATAVMMFVRIGRNPRSGPRRSPVFPADQNGVVFSARCWRRVAQSECADFF